MRQWGEVIRLEVEDGIDKKLLNFLKDELKVAEQDIFQINGPIDFTFLMKMYGLEGCDDLRNEPYTPQRVPEIVPGENIFDEIRKGDILLHHPYQTFDPVVDFIRQASVDPDVLAIKQTLYRVSGNSPIIASLAQAAENGKQVSVLVELKARFDEENNIVWAKKLEQAGCHVIYGLVGLKTHSKIALVVRRRKMVSVVMCILEPVTTTTPQQSYIQTVVFLPVTVQSERMQLPYSICCPATPNHCRGMNLRLHRSGFARSSQS